MGLWRSNGPIPLHEPITLPDDEAAHQLAVLESRVDQVRTRLREVACRERNNSALVNLCLDIENDLHGPYPENRPA